MTFIPSVAAVSGVGIVGGLALLGRGMRGHGLASRIADTSTSAIASIAAGEVRVSGVVEAAEVTLVSRLQSVPCVYYRAVVDEDGDGTTGRGRLVEERAVGFRVRDDTGELRVFPRDARIEAPERWQDRSSLLGEQPAGLALRTEAAFRSAEPDTAAQIEDLLRVHVREASGDGWSGATSGASRSYREARLEPGDVVTIVGQALPFGDLGDPTGADLGLGTGGLADDPEVAMDLAEAREAGALADDPAAAWGNAAIPGFGIGRPVRPATIDPGAHPLPLGDAADAARAERTFEIAPETLVVAAAPDAPLADRLRQPGRGHRAPGGPVPRRPARGGARDRVRDGVRGHARRRVRIVNAASYAAVFAIGVVVIVAGLPRARRATTPSWPSASASTRPGRTSASSCSSATISCRTSSQRSAA